MVTTTGWLYLAGTSVLFFFWAYGIASFVLDVKNRLVPGIRQYRAGRRARKAEAEAEKRREERRDQLY